MSTRRKAPKAPSQPSLEMVCPAAFVPALSRHPALGHGKANRSRYRAVQRLFYDTAAWELAARDIALVEAGGLWQAEPVSHRRPRDLGRPLPPLATSIHPAGIEESLAESLPGPLRPFGKLHGRVQRLAVSHDGAAIECRIMTGTLTIVDSYGEVAVSRSIARIELVGELSACLSLAQRLAADLPVTPALQSLADEVLALAEVSRPEPRAIRLTPEMGLPEAFAGLLRDRVSTLLSWLGQIDAEIGEEPVHQARVTLRRLRALLAAFRPLLGETERKLGTALGGLKAALGPARDWDVFLDETVGPVAQGLAPDDRAVAWLKAAAAARRDTAYSALLDWLGGPAFRTLSWTLVGVTLGEGWRVPELESLPMPVEGEEAATTPIPEAIDHYARHFLHRRWKKISRPVREVAALSDDELHQLRIKCKKLRYQVEIFATVLPEREAKQLIKRLAGVQESMGKHNDGIVAAGLAHDLLPEKTKPAEAIEGLGLVKGFGVGAGRSERGDVLTLWRKLLKAGAF
jgi:triphosphatase